MNEIAYRIIFLIVFPSLQLILSILQTFQTCIITSTAQELDSLSPQLFSQNLLQILFQVVFKGCTQQGVAIP